MSKNQILTDLFYDENTGFQSLDKLYKQAKLQINITKKEVREWYQKQEVNQRQRVDNSKKQSFIAPEPKYQYQCDLLYIMKNKNKQGKNIWYYALTCIDVFTKKADIELFDGDRSSKNVAKMMKRILNRMGKPQIIFTDDGSEFTGDEFSQLLIDEGIVQRFTHLHAPFIEAFHRTIKQSYKKYLVSVDRESSIQAIKRIIPVRISLYNNTVHSTTKFKPNDVNNGNKDQVLHNIIARSNQKVRNEVTIGSRVRVLKKDKLLENKLQKWKPKWSRRVYTVDDIQMPYYIVSGHDPEGDLRSDRKYLRAHIQLIKGDVQQNPKKEEIKNSVKQSIPNPDADMIKKENEQAIEERIKAIKSRRNRKKTAKMIAYEEDNAFEKKQKFYMNRRKR
jgi:hypothetical protein